jgi:Fic family protein
MADIERLTSTESFEFIQAANSRYLYWDRVRFKAMPEGVRPEQMWSAIKFSRLSQYRSLPISGYASGNLVRFCTPPRHQQWLHRIDQMAGGNIGTVSGNAIPDDNDRYLFNSLMEEAIASSRLEGAVSTREKAKKMLRTKRKPRNRSEQMILNNYRAISEIRAIKAERLTPELLLHLQEVLTEDTLDDAGHIGHFRVNNDVHVVDTSTNEIIHNPPEFRSIPERIQEVCDFANKKGGDFVHPVTKAIALHFAIGFIHPFADGNGRTARALFYWQMLKSRYWLFEYLPISRILIREPSRYVRAYLYSELDGGDITYFIHFHLGLIMQAITALHGYIDRQLLAVKEATKIVRAFPDMNHRQSSLLQDCLKHPSKQYTIRDHGGLHRVAYATARADLLDLMKRRLLMGEKRGKHYVFWPPENLLSRIKCTPKEHLLQDTTAPLPTSVGLTHPQEPAAEDDKQRNLFQE